MRTCKRCGRNGELVTWPRYAKNSRLARHCSICESEIQSHAAQIEQVKARGYRNLGATPEYKLAQRRAEAESAGREYRTVAEIAARKITITERKRIERAGGWLLRALYPVIHIKDPLGEAERRNAAFRARYARRPNYERARTAGYKARHADRKQTWDEVRNERIKATSDGTATASKIKALKERTTNCHYCHKAMEEREKQTDHVVALCSSGAHSMANIVIACADCNGRKAKLDHKEFLARQQGDPIAA